MWCGKKLSQKEWKRIYGYDVKSEKGKLAETINHENHRGEGHYKYYLTCEETKEHGMRPNQSCPSRVNDWWVEKVNQKHRTRQNQGWKECEGKAVYYKDPKTDKVIFDMKCWKLVPPGEKRCKDESCIYFTEVYNGTVSEKGKKIKQRWDQHTQERYQKANEWWNSLSLVQKQTELKKEEGHLNNLGLQRQRCWIEKIDKNSILFENGKLYYDNMDKIPPSFLDRFGLPGFQWESVWKNDGNHSHAVFHEVEKEINKKESELKQAKEKGEGELAIQLEKQLQELKNQQQNNNNHSLLGQNHPSKNNLIPWIIGGILAILLGGLTFWVWKKNPKTKL